MEKIEYKELEFNKEDNVYCHYLETTGHTPLEIVMLDPEDSSEEIEFCIRGDSVSITLHAEESLLSYLLQRSLDRKDSDAN
jgi:hypothetical protein